MNLNDVVNVNVNVEKVGLTASEGRAGEHKIVTRFYPGINK
jgi:hypothetical protein